MSTERDELTRIIKSPESFDGGPVSCGPNSVYAARTADAILAAGYRKPRTIATLEELDALPEGAVIRDNDGDVFEAVRCTGDTEAGVPDYNCWDQIAETWPMDSDKIALPAVVLDEAAL